MPQSPLWTPFLYGWFKDKYFNYKLIQNRVKEEPESPKAFLLLHVPPMFYLNYIYIHI